MQGIHEFIIEVKEPMKNKMSLGKAEIFIDPSFDQTKHSNRIGKVISTPIGSDTDVKVGDEVVIQHTILMSQLYQGQKADSVFLVDKEKGYYRLEDSLIIMFRSNPSDEWKCNGIHAMLTPIEAEAEDYKEGGLIMPDSHFNTDVECNTNGFVKQYGIVRYLNKALADQGVEIGDKVYFVDYGDYEFNIDNEILYCMDNRDILAVLK